MNQVLIVEDNPDAAQALALLLRAAGHEVTVTGSGAAALEAARATPPDVIVADVRLPGEIDGLELARRVRADPGLRSIRLVALSGFSDPERQELASRAGFDHYLVKPADPNEIRRLADAPARGGA